MTSDAPSHPWAIAIIILVVVATIVGRGYVAVAPDLWDGQLFSYIGQKWLEGHTPYVDLWDNKSPGIFALLAAVFAVFPRNFVAVAVVEGLLLIGTSAFAYGFLRKAGAPFAAAGLAAACVGVTCNVNRLSPGGMHTEIYTLFPAMASMWFFVAGKAWFDTRWLLGAGISAGVAAIFSPKGLSPVLAQTAFLALCLWKREIRLTELLRSWVALLCGVAIAWTPVAAYFVLKGGLGELVHASLLYNLAYGASSRPPLLSSVLTVTDIFRVIASPLVAGLTAIAVGLGAWWRRTKSLGSAEGAWLAPLLGLWFLADLAGLQAGGRSYFHYFLLPALSSSVAAGYLLWSVQGQPTDVVAGKARGALVALVLGPMLLGTVRDARTLRARIRDPRPKDHIELTAEWIGQQAAADETVFCWDYSPAVYGMTNLDPITAQIDGHHLYDSPAAEAELGPGILRDLRARRPDFVCDRTVDPRARSERDRWYARFREFVEAEYVEVWRIDSHRVFRPRDASALQQFERSD